MLSFVTVYPQFSSSFDRLIVHTGQHDDYELSRVFFEELDTPDPDYKARNINNFAILRNLVKIFIGLLILFNITWLINT